MDIQSIKIDIIHWLTELQDIAVLKELQAFKDHQAGELTQGHKRLLDERIASYKNNPNQVLDWETVMGEIEENL